MRCSICSRVRSGIAIRIQQARFSGQQRARAIHVDRAAFEDHAAVVNRQPERLARPASAPHHRDRRADTCRPRRCVPNRRSPAADLSRASGRSARDRGTTARSSGSCKYVRRSCGNSIEHRARFRFMRAVADVDADRLRLDQRRDHLAERRHHAIVRIRETDPFAARPRKPGSGVRFPFRRHAVAECGRCLFSSISEP